MKLSRARGSGVAMVMFSMSLLLASSSIAQTNSWLSPASGNWEDASWSLGQLPGPGQTILLTNAGFKAVEIRPNTAANFPQTLTVDSLTISSPTNSLNTLLLNFVGVDSPLVVNSLTLNANSVITMHSSALLVQSNMSIGGTFNQNDFSGVTAARMQIGDVGPATYTMSNGTLAVTGLEVLGGWGHTAVFDQEGGYHFATPLWISAGGGEYDLHGGQLGGTVLMKGGILIQSGGDLAVPGFSVDGFYTLLGGTVEAPAGFRVYQGYATQAGGTNSAGPLLLGSLDSDNFGQGSYTLSNGVLNVSSATINYLGTLDQEGGTIDISGPLNMPYFFVGPSPGNYIAGAFYMNGGTFSADSLNSSGWIAQNGGTIQVAGDFTAFFYPAGYSLTAGGLNTSNTLVGPAGITFDQSGGVHNVQHLLRIQGPPGYPYGYQLSGGQLVAPDIEITGSSFTHTGGTINNSIVLTLDAGTWTENTSGSQLGRLCVADGAGYGSTSALSLPDGPCVIHFLGSAGEVWSNNAVLQINNWTGSVTGGGKSQVIFGNDSSGLTSSQLSMIQFNFSQGDFPAKILASGEIVPDDKLAPFQSTVTLARQSSGAMQLNLEGLVNRSYEIDISTDLMNWIPWQTQFNDSGSMLITDDSATNAPVRFYRTILLP